MTSGPLGWSKGESDQLLEQASVLGFYPQERIAEQQRSPVRQEQLVCSYLISSRLVGLAVLSLSPLRNSEGSIIQKGIAGAARISHRPIHPYHCDTINTTCMSVRIVLRVQ